jgi:hypothetical protein
LVRNVFSDEELVKRSKNNKEDDLFNKPKIFQENPNKFEDKKKYAKEVIRQVMKTHQNDVKPESTSREMISKNYVTKTSFPSFLSASFDESSSFYVKAIIPIAK